MHWQTYKPQDNEVMARRVVEPETVRTYTGRDVIATEGQFIVIDDGQTMVMKAGRFHKKYQLVQGERDDTRLP